MNSHAVLFVDDDNELLSCLRRTLAEESYECLFAESGQTALELLACHPVQVLVADLRMPGMSGIELLEEVRERYPDIVGVLLSGNPSLDPGEISDLVQAVHKQDIFMFAAKSVELDVTVKQIVSTALDHYVSKRETCTSNVVPT